MTHRPDDDDDDSWPPIVFVTVVSGLIPCLHHPQYHSHIVCRVLNIQHLIGRFLGVQAQQSNSFKHTRTTASHH